MRITELADKVVDELADVYDLSVEQLSPLVKWYFLVPNSDAFLPVQVKFTCADEFLEDAEELIVKMEIHFEAGVCAGYFLTKRCSLLRTDLAKGYDRIFDLCEKEYNLMKSVVSLTMHRRNASDTKIE